MTNNLDNFQGNVYDSIIETVFLDKIGKVSHEKSTAFGLCMFFIAMIVLIIIYWKCACCRAWVENCCFLCMPDCLHVWREKRALDALQKEEERAERLRQLDPERANTSANQDGVEGNQTGHVSASAPHPEEQATAPGAELPPPGSSTKQ